MPWSGIKLLSADLLGSLGLSHFLIENFLPLDITPIMSLSRATSRLLAVSSRAGVVARSAPALISAGRPSVFACRPRPSQARAFASVSDPLNVSTPKAGTPATAAEPPLLPAALRLKTGQSFEAISFGAPITDRPMSGEVVFTTSLVGYPESMTDPSYRGQILVFTQPLIGNYGVPGRTVDEFGLLEHFESGKIHLSGIIVNDYATRYSHWRAVQSLGAWCASEGIPALTDVDTRALVHILRGQGSTLGEIRIGKTLNEIKNEPLVLEDPNVRNLCAEVSVTEPVAYNTGGDVKIALVGKSDGKGGRKRIWAEKSQRPIPVRLRLEDQHRSLLGQAWRSGYCCPMGPRFHQGRHPLRRCLYLKWPRGRCGAEMDCMNAI